MEKFNQYFMYGISVPYKDYKDWNLNPNEDIFCLFDSRDGKYIIIGRVLEQTNTDKPYLGYKEPFIVPELEEIDKLIIKNSVKQEFGLEGEFHYYFITHSK